MIKQLYRKVLGVDKVSRTFKFKVHVALTFAFLLGIFALIVWGIFMSPRWSAFVAFVSVTGITCILMKKVWDEYKSVELAAKVFGNTNDDDDAESTTVSPARSRSSVHFQTVSSQVNPDFRRPAAGSSDLEASTGVTGGVSAVVISTSPLHTICEDDNLSSCGSDNDDDAEYRV